ncbi:MAG: NAD(P)-dependent oxidoreductase [Candidatus Doudnabacteria bacterium]
MKISFFETKEEYQKVLQPLLPDMTVEYSTEPLSPKNVANFKDSEAIAIFVGSKIDKNIIDSLPKLKAIMTMSTGYDHIDTKYAKQKGIAVCNVAGYGSVCVAEFAFGLILSLSRKITQANRHLRDTNEFSFENLQGFDLNGKILGIIGTGRIGQHVAQIANAFGMKILGFDAKPNPALAEKFQYVSLDELLKQSDVITIHVPYLPSTHHLINKDNLRFVKKGAILVNTARGEIIETEALVAVLTEGRLAGAGLDVLEGEHEMKDELHILANPASTVADFRKLYVNHMLIDFPQVIVTPHMAFYSREALNEIMVTTAENIKSFLQGTPKNLV